MSEITPIRFHTRAGAPALQLGREDINGDTVAMLQQNFGITIAGDSLLPLNGAPTIGAPIQFLQTILPGLVRRATVPYKIDELIGSDAVGQWEDHEVIQGLMEPVGLAAPYTDHSNIPLASYNPGWENRRIVRFEQGYEVGPLEMARMTKAGIDSRGEKRSAATSSLDYTRNEVGFYGFNDGAGRTFGLLNDPGLPAYVVLPDGASGDSEWSTKTAMEVISDLISIMEAIRIQSATLVDPSSAAITVGLPPEAMGSLGKINDMNVSVRGWLAETYPNARFVPVPQFSDANGGESVIIAWADAAPDGEGSSDNGRTWAQIVPERLRVIGSEQRVKTFIEDLSNATAGVMLKRPYLVVARTGV